MRLKTPTLLGTTRKKMLAAVLCGVLVTGIGSGVAFAASSGKSSQITATGIATAAAPAADTHGTPRVVPGSISLYTTDGGKDWSVEASDGSTGSLTIAADGTMTWSQIMPEESVLRDIASKLPLVPSHTK